MDKPEFRELIREIGPLNVHLGVKSSPPPIDQVINLWAALSRLIFPSLYRSLLNTTTLGNHQIAAINMLSEAAELGPINPVDLSSRTWHKLMARLDKFLRSYNFTLVNEYKEAMGRLDKKLISLLREKKELTSQISEAKRLEPSDREQIKYSEDQIKEREQTLARLRIPMEREEDQIAQLKQQLSRRDTSLTRLTHKLADEKNKDARIEHSICILEQVEAWTADQVAALTENRHSELDREIADTQASISSLERLDKAVGPAINMLETLLEAKNRALQHHQTLLDATQQRDPLRQKISETRVKIDRSDTSANTMRQLLRLIEHHTQLINDKLQAGSVSDKDLASAEELTRYAEKTQELVDTGDYHQILSIHRKVMDWQGASKFSPLHATTNTGVTSHGVDKDFDDQRVVYDQLVADQKAIDKEIDDLQAESAKLEEQLDAAAKLVALDDGSIGRQFEADRALLKPLKPPSFHDMFSGTLVEYSYMPLINELMGRLDQKLQSTLGPEVLRDSLPLMPAAPVADLSRISNADIDLVRSDSDSEAEIEEQPLPAATPSSENYDPVGERPLDLIEFPASVHLDDTYDMTNSEPPVSEPYHMDSDPFSTTPAKSAPSNIIMDEPLGEHRTTSGTSVTAPVPRDQSASPLEAVLVGQYVEHIQEESRGSQLKIRKVISLSRSPEPADDDDSSERSFYNHIHHSRANLHEPSLLAPSISVHSDSNSSRGASPPQTEHTTFTQELMNRWVQDGANQDREADGEYMEASDIEPPPPDPISSDWDMDD